jgi:hypothetical protein
MIIVLNPGIDRRVRELPPRILREILAAASRDLIRRPALAQTALHVFEVLRAIHLAALRPRLSVAFLSAALGVDRDIQALKAIAAQLARDRGAISAQRLGNLRVGFAGGIHLGYNLALFDLKMTSSHCWDSV